MSAISNRLSAAVSKRLAQQEERSNQSNVQNARVSAQSAQTSQTKAAASASVSTAKAPSSGSSSRTPVIDLAKIASLVSKKSASTSKNANADSHIPISDVTGSRGLVSQGNKAQDAGSSNSGSGNSGSGDQAPHIPISVVTGSRDITTVSPQLRAYLQQGSPSAATAIPKEYADLANLLDKAPSGIDFDNWADMTAKQQQSAMERSGLSETDQWALLNAAPHYVETIAKVQDVFANRYELGITVADARNIAKELFTIADERDEAINKTGKYANDAVFAPKALRWLDEQEDKLLSGLGKDTNETGQSTWYNGGNPSTAANDDDAQTSVDGNSNGYIQVPGQTIFGQNSNNPAVNCYGYVLMNLGIQPSDGNYDTQPGQLSETKDGDHAYVVVGDEPQNTDIESITNYIVRDMEQTGNSVRVIESYDEATEEERVVALKTTKPFIFGVNDYHCAILLPDGSWADKQGTSKDSRQGAITNPDEDWGAWWNRYNSETIYIAIS